MVTQFAGRMSDNGIVTSPGSVVVDRNDADLLHLTLAGEVDLAAVTDDVLDAVTGSTATSAVLDIATVTFMDSIAMSLLVQVRNRTAVQPTLVGATDNVRELLHVAGLHDLFDHAA